MASFVIHNIVGERLLTLLKENYGVEFSESERNELLLGNLIVDSSRLKLLEVSEDKFLIVDGDGSVIREIEGKTKDAAKKILRAVKQDEKKMTHFRNEDDGDLCIQVPNVSKFYNKYGQLLNSSLSAVGYLLHLYTDKMFFDDLAIKTFDTLDGDLKSTIYTNKVKMMLVKKNNKLYTVEEFWDKKSNTSMYNDYTIMNKILLDHYGCFFDMERLLNSAKSIVNPGINEVDFAQASSVIKDTAMFISQSYKIADSTLNIFEEEEVRKFIDDVVNQFVCEYGYLFGISDEKTNECRKTLK